MTAYTTGRLRVPVTPNGRAYGLLLVGHGPESDLIDWEKNEFKNPADAQRLVLCWNLMVHVPLGSMISLDAFDRSRRAPGLELINAKAAIERLLACEPGLAELSDVDLHAAGADQSAEPIVREQAMAILQARAALAMIGGAA